MVGSTQCRRVGLLALVWAQVAVAQGVDAPAAAAVDSLREQRDRIQQWQRQALQVPDRPAAPAPPDWLPPLPGEANCVMLRGVEIRQPDAGMPTVPTALQAPPADYIGACVGSLSLQRLQVNLTGRLRALGYITSTLRLPEQHLADGVLRLILAWGRLGEVHVEAEGAGAALAGRPAANALALHPGAPLNLRDIEHSLETLARLPSQSARFVIEPGSQPGDSDLRILVGSQPARRAHLGLELQHGGPDSRRDLTGRMWLDAPFGWSDQLLVAFSAAPDHQGRAEARRHSVVLQWTVPYGRHLLSLSASTARHSRGLAGGVGRFVERGADDQAGLRWQWTAARGVDWRNQLWATWNERRGRSHIDDVELLSRRRVASELGIGVSHWQRLGCGETSGELESAHTVRLARLADFQDTVASLPRQWRVQVDWRCAWPDAVAADGAGGGAWSWTVSAWTQAAERPFDGTDLLTLGSRATVRGHAAAQALQGRRISVARVGITSPWRQLGNGVRWQPWLGWDAGRVDRPASDGIATGRRSRQAAVLGLRWLAGPAVAELGWARAVGPSPARRHGQWEAQVHWWF